jgi:hypothetical protein
MEDVLDVYARPYDPQRPVICMDESNKQLLEDTREPLPMAPGQAQRVDHEYKRQGVANLFMFFEPLVGQRHVQVSDQRTRREWAEAMRYLADVLYPEVDTIVVVLDNLNTHDAASFYAAFPPEEAHRLAKRFEFHYTPKHGSWLNMAEIELSVLGRQCLDRRIPDKQTLTDEVRHWQTRRNTNLVKVDWQFTTVDARIKLKHLYPKLHIQDCPPIN